MARGISASPLTFGKTSVLSPQNGALEGRGSGLLHAGTPAAPRWGASGASRHHDARLKPGATEPDPFGAGLRFGGPTRAGNATAAGAHCALADPLELIRLGLSMIAPSCGIARVIREAAWCYLNGLEWGEARERIVTTFGSVEPCNAIPNHGFTVLGWLYGGEFGEQLCAAVNCGFDTDCTGATLGALLGILGGTRPSRSTLGPCSDPTHSDSRNRDCPL